MRVVWWPDLARTNTYPGPLRLACCLRRLHYFPRVSCDHPDMEERRQAGAIDFAVARDPLKRFVSGYYFTNRHVKTQMRSGDLLQYAGKLPHNEDDPHMFPFVGCQLSCS